MFGWLFWGCSSTPSTPSNNEKLSICLDIDKAIIERLQNVDVVLWHQGIQFKDLDLSEIVKIKHINNSKIDVGEYNRLLYSSTIVFENMNGNEIEFPVSSRRLYKYDESDYDYNIMYERGLLYNQYELSPTLILNITPDVRNLPWIYFGYDSSNVYGKYDGIDTRTPVRTGRILVYDTTVQYFHNQVLAQNADQPKRDRTSVQNLIQNLVDVGFNVGTLFRLGDVVSIPQGLLSAIDLSQTNGIYTYLVMLNDQSLKPFYIQTTRRFSNLGSNNTILKSGQKVYLQPFDLPNSLYHKELQDFKAD
jgi:hypothetical protein